MKNKDILIIAFKFPPMGGIGTRRWAKFAKYLAKSGYIIHILTIDYKQVDTINWSHDISNNPNIKIHRTKTTYPYWLLRNNKKKGILKIISELFIEYYKRTSNWLDVAQGWEKYLIPKAKNLINENNIKNVIVTASPVSALYSASFIKIDNPEINLILDYRDPWNDDIHFETISKFSFKNKQKSVRMEITALEIADHILHVSNDITQRYKKIYKGQASKISTLHNGYDKDDYFNHESVNPCFNMVYIGSLSPERSKIIQIIIDCIKKIDIQNIGTNFKIHFYGATDRYLSNHKSICTFHKPVNPKDISKILNQYAFCLSVNIPEMPYAFGSKIFDYMAIKKPIFHISNGGELSELLIKNNQFVSDYSEENIKKTIIKMKTDFDNNNLKPHSFTDYDINNLTQKLITQFI